MEGIEANRAQKYGYQLAELSVDIDRLTFSTILFAIKGFFRICCPISFRKGIPTYTTTTLINKV